MGTGKGLLRTSYWKRWRTAAEMCIRDRLDVDQAKKTVEVSIPEEEGVYGFWIEAIDYKKGVINFFFAVDTRE